MNGIGGSAIDATLTLCATGLALTFYTKDDFVNGFAAGHPQAFLANL